MLFEAVLDGARWTEFLQSTSRCLGASSAFIMSKSPRRDHRPAYEVGLARGTIRRYYEYFHHIDTWWACIPPPVAGRFRLVRGKDLCDSHALLESEFYTEFLVPNRIRYMRALVVTPEAPLAAPFIVSWHRSADQGPFPAEADEAITELGPVLVQAERLGTELVRARIEDVHAEPAYFVLGASGQLLQANAGGASLLEGGMFSAEDGMLRPASVEAAAWLRAHLDTGTIASGFRPVITPLPTAIDGFAAPGGIRARARPLPRLTTALGPEGSAIDHTLEMRAIGRTHGAISLTGAAALLVVHPAHKTDTASLAARTAKLFGWTPTEFDTVWRLYQNASTHEISQARKCSVETVRTHLKHAKRKAGVSRQVELVTLLVQLQSMPA